MYFRSSILDFLNGAPLLINHPATDTGRPIEFQIWLDMLSRGAEVRIYGPYMHGLANPSPGELYEDGDDRGNGAERAKHGDCS